MPKRLVWLFSRRYIAGETISDGLNAAKKLNEEKILVTVDLLGEFIRTLAQAEENRDKYLEIIDQFSGQRVQGNFSLKPTMFGLLIDKEACYGYIREIVKRAAENESFVRIDMEDSQCVDREIELFRRLREEFPSSVGLVLQAYLHRTQNDLEELSRLNSETAPLNFRICKGIYIEPANIAYQDYQVVRNRFLEILEFMFRNKMYVGIATHDKYLIEGAYDLIGKYKVPKNRYEFQMLYGVTPELRQSIINAGHTMRVYL
ncbi:MAG: proline dehydrogenase, partial [Chlorobi bacterium]|nr:proline dehydrogenase [Chlorobiota bacterium]